MATSSVLIPQREAEKFAEEQDREERKRRERQIRTNKKIKRNKNPKQNVKSGADKAEFSRPL